MGRWKTLLVSIASAALLCAAGTPALASSYSTDNSDLWYNEAESGWGVQFVQRADMIFATLYVYNPSHTPVWYMAILNPSNATTWTGDLMQTTGPWFGTTPFDPATVTVNRVGSMSFVATSGKTGMLSYSINGIAVNKEISRETLRFDDYTGDYVGTLSYTAQGCPNPADGGLFSTQIDFSIRQSGSSMALAWQQAGNALVCTSSGNYGQDGQFGNTQQVTGACTDGSGANNVTTYYEMNVTPEQVSMKLSAPSGNSGAKGCTLNGSMVGIRR